MYQGYCDSKTGERIARLRRQREPNRRQFVRYVPGMTYRELKEIENSERQPHLEELLLLANFLKTSCEFLAFGRGRDKHELGIRESEYAQYFLGVPRYRIRQQQAKQHNGR